MSESGPGSPPASRVGVHQVLAKPLAPARDEVENQERQIVGYIELAQPEIELDAVHDTYPVTDKHVFGAEVPVPLADTTAARPGSEQLGVGGHEACANRSRLCTRSISSRCLTSPRSSWTLRSKQRSAARTGAPSGVTGGASS